MVSQFDEGLWQQWPSPSTEICFWHIKFVIVKVLKFKHFTGVQYYRSVAFRDYRLFIRYPVSAGYLTIRYYPDSV